MSTNPKEFRSDLLGARMMWEWVSTHAPHLIDGWKVETDDFMTAFIRRVVDFYPPMPRVFATQAPIASNAIDRWGLTNVVLLGGGTPTPFSPRPGQIRYYTDASAAVVAEARAAGYRAEVVDIRNPADLRKVPDATTAVATGLFHFLSDDAARGVLRMFLGVGLKTFVFNNMRFVEVHETGTARSIDEWAKFGMQLYPRTIEQTRALISDIWNVEDAVGVLEFYQEHRDFGPLFADESDNFSNIYLLTAP